MEFAVDMLRKLVREPDVYECACLLAIGGAHGVEKEDRDERGGEDEPAALVPMPEVDRDDDAADVPDADEHRAEGQTAASTLSEERVPVALSPSTFFGTLIEAALARMPVTMYPEVRHRMRDASLAGPTS